MFICRECGYGSSSWLGKCPNCEAWNSLVERKDFAPGKSKKDSEKLKLVSFSSVKTESKAKKKTGLFELDRVLGGGLTPGAVILLTGEPGVGKSTLLLQSLKLFKTLYISGEESAEQVYDRAGRLKVTPSNLTFSDTLQVEAIIDGVKNLDQKFEVLVIDSIQTTYSTQVDSPAGSVSQLREVTQQLVSLAKSERIPVIMVGHITKEGEVAGPKTLEHFVDCVLSFEGEKVSHFRILRSYKNRFGDTSEIGIFEMDESGLKEITSPAAFLNQEMTDKVPGKAVAGVSEGGRSLFFEIQTLTVSSFRRAFFSC